jgi:hypothetical protein
MFYKNVGAEVTTNLMDAAGQMRHFRVLTVDKKHVFDED